MKVSSNLWADIFDKNIKDKNNEEKSLREMSKLLTAQVTTSLNKQSNTKK